MEKTVPHWSKLVNELYHKKIGNIFVMEIEVDKDYWFLNKVYTRTYTRKDDLDYEADYEIISKHGLVLHIVYSIEKNKIKLAEVYSLHRTECIYEG